MKMNWKLKLIKKSFNNRFAYLCGKVGLNFIDKDFMKEAFRYFLSETRAAYMGERPVYWCSTFVPSELIYALGGVPFMPEIAAGFAATLGFADQMIATGEGEWLNSDVCSIHRCGLGLTLQGLMPEPDYIVSASHLCDGAKKYLQEISMNYDCPFYVLETPYDLNNADYLAAELKNLVAEVNNGSINFRKVFEYSNEAHDYNCQVNKIRKDAPAIITGDRIMNMV